MFLKLLKQKICFSKKILKRLILSSQKLLHLNNLVVKLIVNNCNFIGRLRLRVSSF